MGLFEVANHVCIHIKVKRHTSPYSGIREPTLLQTVLQLTSGKETHQTTEHEQPEVRMIYFEVANHVCIHIKIHKCIMGCLLTLGSCTVGLQYSFCVSVTTLAATYLVYVSQVRCHRVLYGVF